MLPNCCLLSNAPLMVGPTAGKSLLLDANDLHHCAAHIADVALFGADSVPVHNESENLLLANESQQKNSLNLVLPSPNAGSA